MKPGRIAKLPTPAALLVAVAALALVAAGCGGGNGGGGGGSYNSGSDTGAASTTSAYGGKPASTTDGTLSVGKTDLGKILVGAGGRTLYLFERDKGSRSSCAGTCAAAWPPFTTDGQAQAGAGVDEAKLTTTKRADGKTQVVYAGHPLYYYAPDTKAGQTSGQALDQFGAEWYVVSPAGTKVEEGEGS